MGKLAPARVSYRDDFVISYHIYMMTGNASVFSSTHVQRVEADEAILDCLQTDFTPKRVVVSCLHDTVAKSRTGVTFSPRCENQGELTATGAGMTFCGGIM